MKKKNSFFSSARYWNKLVHKFYNLNSKISKLILGKNASNQEVNFLLSKLKKLYKKLSRLQVKAGIKLAGSALALMLATSSLNAQNFSFHSFLTNPNSQNIYNEYIIVPVFADIDSDGDLDLYLGGVGQILFCENDGNNNFAYNGNLNSDGIPLSSFITIFDFGDIDNDGDLDMVMLEPDEYSTLLLYTNNDGEFSYTDTLRTDDGVAISGYILIPDFVDLDDDGDMDLFVGSASGNILKFLNDGTGNLTYDGFFQADGSNITLSYWMSPEFADVDDDGDLDLYLSDNESSSILFYENNGGVFNAPDTVQANGSNIYSYYSFLAFADLDDDSDLDLYVGNNYGVQIYTNTGNSTFSDAGSMQATNLPLNVGLIPTLTFADVDGDSNIELFVGGYSSTIKHFTQEDGFNFLLSDTIIADGELLYNGFGPTFYDVDGDENLELYKGTINGFILKYTIDDAGIYSFSDTVKADGINVKVSNFALPTFADFGDDLNMFVGDNDGYVVQYSIDETGAFSFVDTVYADGTIIDVEYNSAPTFADIDGDLDLDLLIGSNGANGKIYIFSNDGSQNFSNAGFLKADGKEITFNNAVVPAFADIDGDGDLDLAVGEYSGNIYFYINNAITNLNSIESEKISIYPNPTTGLFTIEKTQGFNVQIIDINGRIIKQLSNVDQTQLNIDLSNQPSGIYIVKLFNNSEIKTTKIIVE